MLLNAWCGRSCLAAMMTRRTLWGSGGHDHPTDSSTQDPELTPTDWLAAASTHHFLLLPILGLNLCKVRENLFSQSPRTFWSTAIYLPNSSFTTVGDLRKYIYRQGGNQESKLRREIQPFEPVISSPFFSGGPIPVWVYTSPIWLLQTRHKVRDDKG
jgi:hypothetical protein